MARKKKKSEFDMVYCTVDQVKEVERDIQYLENMLKADQAQRTPKITDIEEFKSEIRKKKKIIETHKPRKLRGQKANRAYDEAKKLKKIIQDAMPSRKDYFQKYPKSEDGHDFDFERTVAQQVAFQTDPKIKKAVQNWKSIMRRLEPDNPGISNIELLRK